MDKTNAVRWSICICTVPRRAKYFKRLMKILTPQVDKYKGKIEVIVFWNNFEHTRGYLRQRMMDHARGEYISSIDDDDVVPKDFCDTIMPLLDGVDYIGFKVKLTNPKYGKFRPVFHSLKYNHWYDDETGYYRGVTHINPIKTEIARWGTFPNQNSGEDMVWTEDVHRYLASKNPTEHYIDRFMYIYENFGHEPLDETPDVDNLVRPRFKSKYINLHPESTRVKWKSKNVEPVKEN